MSETKTTWTLALVDKISSPMSSIARRSEATAMEVNKIGSGFGNIGSSIGSLKVLLAGVGVSFGIFQTYEYLKKSTEEAAKLKTAEDQVKTGLESTGHAAGISFEQIEKVNDAIYHSSNYAKADLMNMQSLLVTFPGITQKTYGQASQAIADMSARTGQDLKSTAIQVGKALQDPILGVTALRRVGVNMNEEQQKVIKNLVDNGKTAEAQQLILNELTNEFGGSAKSAFDATPLSNYHKRMEAVQEAFGNMILKIETKLEPVFDKVSSFILDLVTKIQIHGSEIVDTLKTVGGVLAIVGTGILTYKGIMLGLIAVQKMQALWNGIQLISINVLGDGFLTANVFQKIFAAGQWLVNAALSANPIGIVIGALAFLGTGFYLAWQKLGWFRGGMMAAWETVKGFGNLIKEYVVDRIKGFLSGLGGLAKALGELFSGDFKKAWATAKQAGADLIGVEATKNAINNAKDAGNKIGSAYQEGVRQVADKNKAKQIESQTKSQLNALTGDNSPEAESQRRLLQNKLDAIHGKKNDNDSTLKFANGGISPQLQGNYDLSGSGSGKGSSKSGDSLSGSGVSGVKTINQTINMKNYFTVGSGSDVDSVAEKVIRTINDKLRDETTALAM